MKNVHSLIKIAEAHSDSIDACTYLINVIRTGGGDGYNYGLLKLKEAEADIGCPENQKTLVVLTADKLADRIRWHHRQADLLRRKASEQIMKEKRLKWKRY